MGRRDKQKEKREKKKKFKREKEIKKRLENEKKKREKNELRMKMSFVDKQNSTDNDVEFDQRLFEFIKKNEINIEDLDDKEVDKPLMIPQQEVEEIDLSDLS